MPASLEDGLKAYFSILHTRCIQDMAQRDMLAKDRDQSLDKGQDKGDREWDPITRVGDNVQDKVKDNGQMAEDNMKTRDSVKVLSA